MLKKLHVLYLILFMELHTLKYNIDHLFKTTFIEQFGRWSLLILGVSYGTTRQHFLQNKEDKTKDIRHNLKIEKEAKIAEEKKKFADGNILNIFDKTFLNDLIYFINYHLFHSIQK